MSYTSLEFFILFSLTMALYYVLPRERDRFWILLGSSLLFYAWAGFFDFAIFIAVVLVTYLSVLGARRFPRRRRAFLSFGIFVLVAHLFAWKYLPWAATLWGADLALPLPLGISFFTLQGVAYLVDFLRREADFMSLREFLLFKTFFAQLIAGPIVRAYEIVPYLRSLPKARGEMIMEGLFRICLGFVKKLVIADHMAIFVETAFSNPASFTPGTLIVGAMAFYFQIWGDFSGYTDIGRGCAMLLGWKLPENFYSPVYALSPTDWARRWHVTLGRWMLLYVYVPVASSVREGLKVIGLHRRWLKQALSLAVTLIAVGVWHGAAANFFIYGLGLCFLFYCEMIVRRFSPLYRRLPRPVAYVLAFAVFYPAELGMCVLFRSPSLEIMGQYFHGIFNAGEGRVSLLPYAGGLYWRFAFVFALEAVMYFDLRERRYPAVQYILNGVRPVAAKYPRTVSAVAGLALGLIFAGALAMRTGDNLTGFIYFRF